MRRFFVGGNWKCNNTFVQTQALVNDVLNKLVFDPSKVEVVVAPVFLHLGWARENLQKNVQLAAQNSSLTKQGAFTGEISVDQIKDFGVPWVIIGHSERRTLFGETNDIVGKKVRLALDHKLGVIACFGERLEERESGNTINVVKQQLDAIKNEVKEEHWANIVLAYEPVWAIGTGKTASPEQAQDVHKFIREYLHHEVSPNTSNQTRVIYGGSVTDKNAADLIKKPDIDGFLVGGASLKPAFADIVEACNKGR